MYHLLELVVALLWLRNAEVGAKNFTGITKALGRNTEVFRDDFYGKLIEEIDRDRTIESILLMQRYPSHKLRLAAIHNSPIPKMLLAHGHLIDYKDKFNSDILVVLIITDEAIGDVLRSLAHTLNYMRQARILVIAVSARNSGIFKEIFLSLCKVYKMSNVILHFANQGQRYCLLRPYPKYHLQEVDLNGSDIRPHYKQHWMNMEKAPLITTPNEVMQESFSIIGPHGRVKLSGVGARLVLLFGAKYNASLKFPYELRPGEVSIPMYGFQNLTENGLVNIPMAFHSIENGNLSKRISYPMHIGGYMIMLPTPQKLLVKEVYGLLIPQNILLWIILSSVAFSILHNAIDYLSVGQFSIINIFMSDKVLPGILGQSFELKLSSLASLKIIYFLIFLLGLNLNTIFSANFSTLITSPPYQKRIETIEDLKKSNLKIIVEHKSATLHFREKLETFESNIIYSPNGSFFQNARKSLNPKYGYSVPMPMWNIFVAQQSYFGQKLFYITPQTKIINFVMYGTCLDQNSLLMDPLNRLIHLVHDMGLADAWRTDGFLTLIKHKNITKAIVPSTVGSKPLNEDDLLGTWVVLIVGLSSSFIVYVLEIVCEKYKARRTDYLHLRDGSLNYGFSQ